MIITLLVNAVGFCASVLVAQLALAFYDKPKILFPRHGNICRTPGKMTIW